MSSADYYKFSSYRELIDLIKTCNEDDVLLLDFSATWCGPCKKFKKDVWPRLVEKYPQNSNVKLIYVDVDNDEDIGDYFEVKSLPTFIFLKADSDGSTSILKKIIGYNSENNEVEKTLDSL